MTRALEQLPGDRVAPSREEAGTAPDDRSFRPDVEGLRAVAVVLVVLYHAGVVLVGGGYVGVDVFFVISGFVITGLLLRERSSKGSTSILHFYGRRARRILPAATLVVLAVVAATFVVLGTTSGASSAGDGRWVAVFLANFHFQSVGTNYFTSTLPPSPLQNFWSLSVEEQFYVVYPTLFLLVAGVKGRVSLRTRLTVLLVVVIVSSYWVSVTQTTSSPTAAYFSPFARAWELALGALVAVSTVWLKRLPSKVAAGLTWVGLAAVVGASIVFTSKTAYPGSLVAIPVIGAALVIAGGSAAPRQGAERLLGRTSFSWLGRRSYSIYLWHWPILVIAAEQAGLASLPAWQGVVLLVVIGLPASMLTYALVENPIRHSSLSARTSVLAGLATVLVSVLVLTLALSAETPALTNYDVPAAANLRVVLRQVAAAPAITRVPHDLVPPLDAISGDWGGNVENPLCQANYGQSRERICDLGDPTGMHTMVVYGDSHALMWLPTFDAIAKAAGWRLIVLAKYYCPAEPVVSTNQVGVGNPDRPFVSCETWHRWAIHWINKHQPQLLVVTQEGYYDHPGIGGTRSKPFTPTQWKAGLLDLIHEVHVTSGRLVILGNTPTFYGVPSTCLKRSPSNVRRCSESRSLVVLPDSAVEQQAAAQVGSTYIDPIPWFCSSVCTAIIDRYAVYVDNEHVTGTYASHLRVVLANALELQHRG